MGELVAGGELLDEHAVTAALESAGRLVGLTENDVRKAVRRGLRHGRAHPRRAPEGGQMLRSRSDAVVAVTEWWEAVQGAPWRGRRAGTTLKILGAVALIATRAGKLRLEISYRQLAEAAGVSVGTITKHLPDLLPWVAIAAHGSRVTGAPTVWQVVPRRANGNSASPRAWRASGLFPTRSGPLDPAEDSWTGWGNGWRLYGLLHANDDGIEPGELVEATGLHPTTVRRALRRFEHDGIAAPDGDGRWRTVVNGEPGSYETLRRRRGQYERDRENWRRWRAAFAGGEEPLRRAA